MKFFTFGWSDIKHRGDSFAKSIFAEFLGNIMLNFFGCASMNYLKSFSANVDHGEKILIAALSFGMTMYLLVLTLAPTSEAQLNPAISLAMFSSCNMGLIKCLSYIAVQCCGSILGSVLLYWITMSTDCSHIGHSELNANTSQAQGFAAELAIGFLLGFVYSYCKYHGVLCSQGPVAIGISTALGTLSVFHVTGACMNPAKALGTSIVCGNFSNHWIYWIGPCCGAVGAAQIFAFVLTGMFTSTESDVNDAQSDNYGLPTDER